MKHLPTAIGMVLCEQVIVEEGSHNVTPVNCFNHRELDELPGEGTFCAVAWLADGEGELSTQIIVERLDTLDEVYRYGQKFHFINRLQESRCVAKIRGCKFPVAGHYQVSLLIDGEFIAHRRFRVHTKGAKP